MKGIMCFVCVGLIAHSSLLAQEPMKRKSLKGNNTVRNVSTGLRQLRYEISVAR